MELKLDTYIFIHHRGQFSSTDTKTKIPATVGKALFIDVWHDVNISNFIQFETRFFVQTTSEKLFITVISKPLE
jgi:hypothetical protein